MFIWLNENVHFRVLTKIRPFRHKNRWNIKKCALLFPHYVPQERCFQLVKIVLKKLPPGYLLGDIAMFCHRRMGQNFRFHHIFVWHVIDERGVYLGFAAQRHNLLLICRKIKSQDDFVLSCPYKHFVVSVQALCRVRTRGFVVLSSLLKQPRFRSIMYMSASAASTLSTS